MRGPLAAVLTALLIAPASAAGAAPSGRDAIAEKRAEARRLQGEIEELGRQASIVLEDYNEAAAHLEETTAELNGVRTRVSQLRVQVTRTQDLADARILDMYMGVSTPTPVSLLDQGTVTDVGIGQHYADLLAADDRATVSRLRTTRADLSVEKERLAEEQEVVAAEEAALAERREDVEAAMDARGSALADAEGDIARLVEAERRRQAAEEARRAREALEAQRRAEEEARRQAALAPDPEETTAPEVAPDIPPPPVGTGAAAAVAEAQEQIGKPYQWAGSGPDTFDCSGLTAWAWAAAGVTLPHSSRAQYAVLPHVAFDAIEPGDLLFFGNPIHHVGIYVGGGQMVNAPYTGEYVRYDSIYRSDFAGAGRPG